VCALANSLKLGVKAAELWENRHWIVARQARALAKLLAGFC
jgi:hypothetical protein